MEYPDGIPPASLKILMYHLYWKPPFLAESPPRFPGTPFLTGKHIFLIKKITTLEAGGLYLFCLAEEARLCQTLHLFLLNFILLVPAELFRLSKQFQILVLGSILLAIPPAVSFTNLKTCCHPKS